MRRGHRSIPLFLFTAIHKLYRRPPASKSVLIIKPDGIGDYLLCRESIRTLLRHPKWKGHHFHLVGNSDWKELYDAFDSDLFDRVVWVDRQRYFEHTGYAAQIIGDVRRVGYEEVVYISASREFMLGDHLVWASRAKYKVGLKTDRRNLYAWQKGWGDRQYNRLLEVDHQLFESELHAKWVQAYTGQPVRKDPLPIDADAVTEYELPNEFAVLFIGASQPERSWKAEYFAEVASRLWNDYNLHSVVVGGEEAVSRSRALSQSASCPGLIDIVGKTSLSELLQILAKGKLLVSNESMAPHAFNLVNSGPRIVILNDIRAKPRYFSVTAENAPNFWGVEHPSIQRETTLKDLERGRFILPDMSEISVERVWDTVVAALKGLHLPRTGIQ